MTIAVLALPADFGDWEALRRLIRRAFGPMDGVIDPPSSTHDLTGQALAEKAAREQVFIARKDGELVGCFFLDHRGDYLYGGRFAVDPACHGQGIGRALMEKAFAHATALNIPEIELQARIELTDNHAIFRRFGFVEIKRTSHPGFTRPTSITFRRRCNA
ncbi:GNAT family N-acetyltransferase [Tianweitania sp. BSSL-BM11]|uniref:GNAT family N-acetyltransferase n=1 Tax=Tianweitania aestuarii TaxID=2814886 RepID=A0ABS5RQB9_9HYPH|nr:GNAT family N-acetyltransferase [Tianweitania aestuarii]MBS9719235.1 GNAT family N-acetyltransferase [Tianweitania aestuarii]